MIINLIYDNSTSQNPNLNQFKATLNAAAQYLSTLITSNLTVSINVGWGELQNQALPTNAAGVGTTIGDITTSYSTLVNALSLNANNIGLPGLATYLSNSNPFNGFFDISSAQAQLLGLQVTPSSGTNLVGAIGFNSTLNWSYTTQGNTINPNQYDLYAVALHELTHAIGRINFPSNGYYSSLNLYSFSSPSTLTQTYGQNSYLSLDGGATNIANFSTTADPADWSSLVGDTFNAGIGPGVVQNFSFADKQLLETLGYSLAPSYQIIGPSSVNEGNTLVLQVNTVGLAAGSNISYSISGISPFRVNHIALNGYLTLNSIGDATISIPITNDYYTDGSTTLNLSINGGQANYQVNVNDTSLTPATTSTVSLSGLGVYSEIVANQSVNGIINHINTVSFNANSTDFSITVNPANQIIVNDSSVNGLGTEVLNQVQRLKFNDISLAFDINTLNPSDTGVNNHAGLVAELAGILFGGQYINNGIINNQKILGIGINLLDNGLSLDQLVTSAFTAVLGNNLTPTQEINLIYQNIYGYQPSSQTVNYWLNQISQGHYTPVSLAEMAMFSPDNINHINLTGIAQQGLTYL